MGVGTGWKDPTRYMSLGLLGTEDLWGADKTVDQDYLNSQAKMREYLDQIKNSQYQTAYSGDWLKNRLAQVQGGQQNLLDENAGQAASQAQSQWDALAMNGGVGQGGNQSRLAYGLGKDQAVGRQQILNQGAQQNLDANLQDYSLKAQDIAQRQAFEQNKWQALVNGEASMAVGLQQAKKPSGGLFGAGGVAGTGMFT